MYSHVTRGDASKSPLLPACGDLDAITSFCKTRNGWSCRLPNVPDATDHGDELSLSWSVKLNKVDLQEV